MRLQMGLINNKNRTLIALLAFLFLGSINSYAQIEDCVGAFPVCGNGSIDLSPTGSGIDDFAKPGNNPPSCRFYESKNVWLRFEIKQAGTLGFDIIPEDLTGPNRDDYDFAIYGPNVTCNTLGSSIRCSSTNPQRANVGAKTGMNETETDINEGPGELGNGYIHWFDNVQVGEVYYLLIDNFDQDAGFQLEWTGSALLQDVIKKENGGVDLGNDLTICSNETATIDATTLGGVEYEWNTGETTPTISVDSSGDYFCQVTTSGGCYSRDTINVKVFQAPAIQTASISPNNICQPNSAITFSATGSPGNYEWFDPSGNSIGQGQSLSKSNVTASDSGTYTVQVTSANGCQNQQEVVLTLYPLPDIQISGLVPYCETDNLNLTASGAQSYQWYDPSGSLISSSSSLAISDLQVSDSGTYQIVGQDTRGCENTLSIDIEVFPELTVDIGTDLISACTSDQFSVSAQANQSSVTYKWYDPLGNEISQSSSIQFADTNVEDSGYYKVVIENQGGCIAEDSVFIDIDRSYLFEELIEQCPGSGFIVPQTGQVVTQSDTIQVDLLTRNGCDSIYVYDVQFLSCGDDLCTGFPNAFAPNNNGYNDEFKAIFQSICVPSEFHFKLFNRWGELVFETKDYRVAWDGYQNGELAIPDIYIWQIDFKFPDDNESLISKSGTVTLVR